MFIRRITKPPTTDSSTGPPPTHRPPTTYHRPTDRSSSDHRPPTPEPAIGPPPTHQSPTTDSPTQLTKKPLTHETYFNRVTTGLILSLIYFNSSFGLDAFYY